MVITRYSRVLLEKLTSFQLVKKFPTFYSTRRFITSFTRVRHQFLSEARCVQSMPPPPIPLKSILILPSHLRLGFPSGLFPSRIPTKTLHTPLLSPKRATCHAHLILLHFITRTIEGEEQRSLSSSLFSFLHSPVTSSLFGPNIILNTLFSDTLSLCSYLNVSDQVSHPYKTGKIVVPYILIFKFFDSKLEDKSLCTEWQQAYPDFKLLLISSWIEFWFVKFVPKYLNSSKLAKKLLSILIPWHGPAFWFRDMTMYLVLSAFTSSSVFLLATTKASIFFFIIYTLPHNILTSSA